jgi:hypothetical protein
MAGLPQAALRADRRSTLASAALPLDEGLDFEARTGRPVMRDPDVIQRLTGTF